MSWKRPDPLDDRAAWAICLIFLPPLAVALFVLEGAAAGWFASGWVTLSILASVAVFVRVRRPKDEDPAALIAARNLRFRLQNDRVLAGKIDGISLKAIGSPSGVRIDAHFEGKVRRSAEDWAASLPEDRVLSLLQAIGDEPVEIDDGKLRLDTRLSFASAGDGEALAQRIRDVARIAKALGASGAPPDGAVACLRNAGSKLAPRAAGTLSIAEPPADGAVSVANRDGALTLPRKS